MKKLFLGLLVTTTLSLAIEIDCNPRYRHLNCNPNISFSAEVQTQQMTVHILKYMPGITVAVFHGQCTGTVSDTLQCKDPNKQGTFLMRKMGVDWAASFDGDPASPDLWGCWQN